MLLVAVVFGSVCFSFLLLNSFFFFFFFFNDTATTEIYTLSLHDALPISLRPHGDDPLDAPPRRPNEAGLSHVGLHGVPGDRGAARARVACHFMPPCEIGRASCRERV